MVRIGTPVAPAEPAETTKAPTKKRPTKRSSGKGRQGGADHAGAFAGTGEAPGAAREPATAEDVDWVMGTPLHDSAVWEGGLELEETDRHIYRASGLGGDTAMLVASAMGMVGNAMPAQLRPYLDEGTAAEPRILAMVHDELKYRPATYTELVGLKAAGVIAGYDTLSRQVQLRLEVGKTALVRAHCDEVSVVGAAEGVGTFVIVEAKAFGPTLWKQWIKSHDIMAFPRYAWQVSALMHATGFPVLFAVGEKDRAAIDAGDPSAIKTLDVRLITDAPFTMAQLKGRVLKAEAMVNKGEVPMCDEAHWPCPYFDRDFCLGKPPADEKPMEDLDDTELGRLLGLYYAYTVDMQATEEQKEAERERKKVKDQIDKLIADKGLARSTGDDSHVYRVWDDAGNEYEYEWVRYPITARGATEGNKVNVKLVINADAVAPEDHPE